MARTFSEGLKNAYLAVQGSRKFKREEEDADIERRLNMAKLGQITNPVQVPGYANVGNRYLRTGALPRSLNVKEQFDLEQSKNKKEFQEQMVKDEAQSMLDTVGEVKKGMNYFGPLGNVPTILSPSSLRGEYGARKNWEVNINKVLSGKAIEIITKMKQASRTGATGFGQLSNRELDVLQSASTALRRNLAPEDAARYLEEIEKIENKVLGYNQKTSPIQNDSLEYEAQEAIKNGADPNLVKQRLAQLRLKNG